VSRLARVTAASVAGVLIVGSVVLTGGAAHADAVEHEQGGLTFALDDGTQTAQVTGYDRVSPDVVIPDAIVANGSTSYDVTAIDAYVFLGAGVESVTIGANVTTIGDVAFAENSLETLALPASVRTIGSWAFDANNISTLSFSDSAIDLGFSVFSGNDLTEMVIPNWMTTIPENIFDGNQIASVTIPETVTEIAGHAFGANLLTSVDIPGSVVTLGDDAFADNVLSTLTLNEGLSFISGFAFKNNNLTSVSIPASVEVIGEGAFDGNTGLTRVEFAGDALMTYMVYADDGGSVPSLGRATGLTVHYLSQFDGDGGFSSPTWRGYASAMDVIVSFELNGHGDAAAAQRIESGTAPAVPTVPVAAGWVFGGWFSDDTLLEPFDFSAVVSADVTAYAKWTAEVVVPEPVAASLALELDLVVGQAAAGATLTASGEGLREGSEFTVILRSAPVELVRETLDASGAFSATAVLPAGLTAGAHTVTLAAVAADGTAMSRIAYLTVNTSGIVTYLSYSAAEPVSPVEPVPSPEPVSPSEPVPSPEPVSPTEPVASPEPVSPVEPVSPAEPVSPSEPVSPPETVTPSDTVAPAAEPGEPATDQAQVLARTGFAGAPLGFAALMALLAGGALILSRRRSVA
jgi:uncharacterized repeat protein (TIGR02543 family)